MKEEMDKTSKCLDIHKEKFDKAMSSKDEELNRLQKTLTIQTEALENLKVTYCDLTKRNESLEKDRREKEQLFIKLEILDNELKERQLTMEDTINDANQRAESLAIAKENFNTEVDRWKSEVKRICEDINKVERERDDSLAEIKKLRGELQGLQSKYTMLEKETLNKEVACLEQNLLLKDKTYLQAEVTHLADQLTMVKIQFSKEVSARVDIERKMEDMHTKTLLLEDELEQETQKCLMFEKEIQAMRCALESEKECFESILDQIKERHNLELAEEKLKTKSLMEDLEQERAIKTKLQLDDDLRKKQDMESERNYGILLQEKIKLDEDLQSEKSLRQELETKMITLNEELSSERMALQKTSKMLDDEIARNEETHKLLSESMSKILKNERLIQSLKDDLDEKEKIMSQLKCSQESVEPEKQKSEIFQKELTIEKAKCEELIKQGNVLQHQLLEEKRHSISLEETYTKINHSLGVKVADLQAQIESANLKVNEKTQSYEMLKKEIVDHQKDLENEIAANQIKVASLAEWNEELKEELQNFKHNQGLHEKSFREMEEQKKQEIAFLKRDVEDEQYRRLKAELEVEESMKKIEAIYKQHEERVKYLQEEFEQKQELQTKSFQETEEQYNHEMERLARDIEDECSKRLKAEEGVEENLRKITELKEQHEENVKKLQKEFDQVQEEREKQHSLKEQSFREREEVLSKEKEKLMEDLEYLVNQGASGDGIGRQPPSSFHMEEETKRAEVRLQGVKSYYQKLLDETCFRSAAREAAIQRAAKMEVTRARREIIHLNHQLEAERCAHRIEKLKLENELKGTQPRYSSSEECKSSAELKDGQLDSLRPEIKAPKEIEKDAALQRSPPEQKGMLKEKHEVPVKISNKENGKCTNVPKKLPRETKISSHRNHSEMSIGMASKNISLRPKKKGNDGTETPGNCRRTTTVASMRKSSSPQSNEKSVDGSMKSPALLSTDGTPRCTKEDVRATKSDGIFKTGEKENQHSCKQILEKNILHYLGHVKNNSPNVRKLRSNERGEGNSCRKGFIVGLISTTTTNKIWKPETKLNLEGSSNSLVSGMELNMLRGCVPPSEGSQIESVCRTKERVKTNGDKEKICGKFIKSLSTPKNLSFNGYNRRNDYQKHSSNTNLADLPTIKRKLKSN
ncbi:interaptin-like [Hetaerina americana]|uniref:interaptin-like n=1 Tax=Hetaerina americana TaxID=62018 RepID=UPI003A7F61AC